MPADLTENCCPACGRGWNDCTAYRAHPTIDYVQEAIVECWAVAMDDGRWLSEVRAAHARIASLESDIATCRAERDAALRLKFQVVPDGTPTSSLVGRVVTAKNEHDRFQIVTIASIVEHAKHCQPAIPTPDRPSGGCICGAWRQYAGPAPTMGRAPPDTVLAARPLLSEEERAALVGLVSWLRGSRKTPPRFRTKDDDWADIIDRLLAVSEMPRPAPTVTWLEWKEVRQSPPLWLARVGHLALSAWQRDGIWEWNVEAREPKFPDEEGSILRYGTEGESFEAAKLAAESAAVRLLLDGLTSVPVEAPEEWKVVATAAGTVSSTPRGTFFPLSVENSIALGHALIAAAMKPRMTP